MYIGRIFALIWGVLIITTIQITRLRKLEKKNGSIDLQIELFQTFFYVYGLLIIIITLFPLQIYGFVFESGYKFAINLIPFINTYKAIMTQVLYAGSYMKTVWLTNILGNLFLLFPLGVMLPIINERFLSVGKTVLFGFILTVSIESIQLLSQLVGNVRAFDIDDIILNTLGCLLGIIFFKCIVQRIIRNKQYFPPPNN